MTVYGGGGLPIGVGTSVLGRTGIDVSIGFGLGLGFGESFLLPLQLVLPVALPLDFVVDAGALALRFCFEGLTRTNMVCQYGRGFGH